MTANTKLRSEIEAAINRCSAENGSDTPDFILAEFLCDCLTAWDKGTLARNKWYGVKKSGGMASMQENEE